MHGGRLRPGRRGNPNGELFVTHYPSGWLRTALVATLLLVAGRGQVVCAQGTQAAPPAATRPSAQTSPTTAATQPTSAPVERPNFLPSPRRLVAYFLAAARERRYDDAQRCLNFKLVDPVIASEHGREYVTQLAEILDRLTRTGYLKPDTLPDQPDAKPVTFGEDPIYVTLMRQDDRRWRFSAQTVKDIPNLYKDLDKLERPAEAVSAPPATDDKVKSKTPEKADEFDWRQSPHALLTGLFVKMIAAADDPSVYQDALACMDFSIAGVQKYEQRVEYLRNLYTILEKLVESEKLNLDALPDKLNDQSYHIPVEGYEITLKRMPDGRWAFAALTVARIPDMIATLKAEAAKAAKKEGKAADRGAVVAQPIRADTSSPRATMNLFLRAMNDGDLDKAARCLDLRGIKEPQRDALRLLAGKLWMVLNRTKFIIPQELPAYSDGPVYTVLIRDEGVIEIGKVEDGPRKGEWLFTRTTVHSIEPLYEATENLSIVPELRGKVRLSFWDCPPLYVRETWVPRFLRGRLATLRHWQWLGIVLVLALGLAVRRACLLLLPWIGRRALATEQAAMLPSSLRHALQPTSTFVMLLTWWGGLQLLDLGAAVMGWIWWAMHIVLAVVGVVAVYRLVDVLTGYFNARAARTKNRLDDVLVPLAQRTAKVLIIAFGILFVGSALGLKIGPLLAGLGVGGLAFGLAAQDTLKNFFGSVNVVLDRPFQVGDWVKIGDAEGTVEAVGLRSSRIRTFYNSQVTIPNSDIMNATIDNLGRRRYRRIYCHLAVTYSSTPEQLDAFCEGIRELIREHPYTRKDYYHVYVNRFGASSIDVLLYCFLETPDWSTELRERHRLFLDIIRLAGRLRVEFAFPTQTIHLHQETGPPPESPLPPTIPTLGDEAITFGKEQAAEIVRQEFGETVEKPPPVTF